MVCDEREGTLNHSENVEEWCCLLMFVCINAVHAGASLRQLCVYMCILSGVGVWNAYLINFPNAAVCV